MLPSRVTSTLLVLLAFPLVALTAPASGPELQSTLEREVPRLLREGDITGISIAVIRDRKIAWSGAYGVADPASGAPVRADTVFQAASLTKPVFAYTVLRLADRGVIDLDQPLWSIVPEPRLEKDPRARQITARHVLSHTTGLPNWGGDTLETAFPPGERFGYSGEGFVWLQKVAEKLTGTPPAELVRREALDPLGMTRSSLIWQERYADSAAVGVDELGILQPIPRSTEPNAAASLRTTAEDYARFLLAMVEGTGLKPETRKAMLTPRVQVPSKRGEPLSPPREDVSWGLGWGLQGAGTPESFWHWGHMDAWRAFTAVRQDGSAGFVYFANSHEGLNIARAIAALAMGGPQPGLDGLQYESYDDPRRLARREIYDALKAGPEAGARRWRELRAARSTVVDDELTQEIAGSLIDRVQGADAAAILRAAVAEKPGSAELQDHLGAALLSAGDLEAAQRAFERARSIDPKSPPREAEIRWIQDALEARKRPVSLSDEELRRLAGDYGPRHVTLDNGRLLYRRDGRPRSWALSAMTTDTFLVEGNGSIRIRFAAAESGKVTKLVILGPNGVEGESPRN